MNRKEYLYRFNWDNFHYTCSHCDLPIETGKEEYHLSGRCSELIESTENKLSMSEKRKFGLIMSNKLRFELMFLQEGKCTDCGIEEWRLKKHFHAHRIKPGAEGGRYVADNVVLICPKCHYRRHHE